jgi:hypothetical protein
MAGERTSAIAECREMIARKRRIAAEHRRNARFHLKGRQHGQAAEQVVHAEQAEAFAEGIDFALRKMREG